MANPQVEEGNTRFANDLLEAMIRAKFSGSEMAIILSVARKTYGWQKKSDEISISQFVQITGMSHRGVCKATLSLVNKKALGREQKGTTYVTKYWINKDYNTWLLSSEQKGTSERLFIGTSEQTGIQLVNKKAPTKETIQKKVKKGPSAPKTVFIKPAVSQIEDYCRERGNSIDAEYFFDKMEIVGWVYGKNKAPVKDWKAVIRTWERYSKDQNGHLAQEEVSATLFDQKD